MESCYDTGLFRYDYRHNVGPLGYSHCRSVTQSEIFGQRFRLGYRQYGGRRLYLVTRYNHGTVMQRTVFEENSFNELLVKIRIDLFAFVPEAAISCRRLRLRACGGSAI